LSFRIRGIDLRLELVDAIGIASVERCVALLV
jgi:hypothetical protein